MNNLPKYYEKYFDEKFSNLDEKIDEKFREVIDEMVELKKMVKDNTQRISILEAFKDKAVLIAVFGWGLVTAVATVGYDYIKSKFF